MIDSIVLSCCDCKRIYNRMTEQWFDIPELYKLYIEEFGRLTHGYCPKCYDSLIEDIEILE